jgi:hypothetical protein
MLAGAIMHDPVVSSMRMRPEFQTGSATAFETNWSLLFEKLGPGGRMALKDRIVAGHGK